MKRNSRSGRASQPRTANGAAEQNAPPAKARSRSRRGGLPDAIISALVARGTPISLEDLFEALSAVEVRHRRAIVKRLESMERAGQVVRNRRGEYGLAHKMDLVTGRVHAHRDGYGFLLPEEGTGDLFLSPPQMRALMHGDRIIARVVGVDQRGRREGALVEVLERGVVQVVGRFWREGDAAFVRPDHARLHQDVLVTPGDEGGAVHGDLVVVDITEPPRKQRPPLGKIVEVLGAQLAPGMAIEVALRTYAIPREFSAPALAEAAKLGEKLSNARRSGREDLRDLPLVTIDGADAMDFDDAVHCVPTPAGWRLTVAIADVSSYVVPGSALDQDAQTRGTSVYFPEHVVPMLPEGLSNGLCSLRPGEDRLCLACEMLIGQDGTIRRSRFTEAVMRSHARLTYDEVAAVLVGRDADARERLAPVVGHLEALHEVYGALRDARERRGALDLDSTESRLRFDDDGNVTAIETVLRNDAHRLIEECMVAANVAAARFLERHRVHALFRIHDGPNAEKLSDLRAMLKEFGLTLGGGLKPTPKDYAKLLERLSGKPEAPLIQVALLRSLTQAVYSPANTGHFGLGLDRYMHFTSPIRRYPDLLVHRAIRHVLSRRKPTAGALAAERARGAAKRTRRSPYPYQRDDLTKLGEHCSMTERRAEDATRDVVYRLKSEYLSGRVGEEFAGVVSGVAPYGVFVTLTDVDIAGLVHVSELGADYFHFDPVAQRLSGERSGRVFKAGDDLRVRVVRVEPEDRKIDLQLVGAGALAGRSSSPVDGDPEAGRSARRAGRRFGSSRGLRRRRR